MDEQVTDITCNCLEYAEILKLGFQNHLEISQVLFLNELPIKSFLNCVSIRFHYA